MTRSISCPGKVRVKQGGGAAGHNGLRSIDAHLGPDYWRIRLGVGHPGNPELVKPYVLQDFTKEEQPLIATMIEAVVQALPLLLAGDGNGFMSKVDVSVNPPRPKPPRAAPADEAKRIRPAPNPPAPRPKTTPPEPSFNALISKGQDTDHGIFLRHRRPAQCGQVDALQRADLDPGGGSGQLPLLHHRTQCRQSRGARRPAGEAGGAGQIGKDRPHPARLRRYRGPGARCQQGRRAGQQIPRQHPRGRCHRPCAALLRGRGDPCGRVGRSAARCRYGGNRIDAGRSRQSRAPARCCGQEGQGRRQGIEGETGRDRGRLERAARRPAGPPRGTDRRAAAVCSTSSSF